MSAFAQQNVEEQALRSLAKEFITQLSPVYENKNKGSDLSFIPDGTTLLLRPQVDKFTYPGAIYSIKNEGLIYLSLVDVIDVLELAIKFDDSTKTGSGWFAREDWTFDINLNQEKVISRGQEYKISNKDIYTQDNIIFIAGEALSEWLDLRFDYDLSQQYVLIESQYPLPAIARYERRQRLDNFSNSRNQAVLPRVEAEKKNFDINAAEINSGLRFAKGPSGFSNTRGFTNISAQGQLLKHDSYALAAVDSDSGLRTIRSRLSKQSEDPNLLGPLKARFYQMGDVNTTDIPLTGDTKQNLGFTIDNNPLVNFDFNNTDIEGDGIPGYDVELYRNGILIGTQTIEDDGRYLFDDVSLFAGDNNFEILFYGIQGQISKETLSIPVTEALLSTQRDTYEISAQIEETNTYQFNPSTDPDKGELHLAGRYNKFIGNNLAYLGLRTRSIEEERKFFASTGLTSVLGGTILDSNFAMDEEANLAMEAGARRNIADWDVSLNGQFRGDEFKINDSDEVTTVNLTSSAKRDFKPFIGRKANILANATYQETASGKNSFLANLGVSNQLNKFNISNILSYEKRNDSVFSSDDEVENSIAIRGNIGKTYVRAGMDVNIKPDTEIDRYFSQFNYRHDYRKGADLFLEYNPIRDYSRGRLNLNYTNDYFRTSPFLEISSDNRVFAGVNLNFSLTEDSDINPVEVTSEKIINRGLAKTFVYYDKNGNEIFDADDEALPDVIVESINSRKRVPTTQTGLAFLKGMPVGRPTDIKLDEESLPDSFMISAFKGSSILPVAGQTHNLVFPVHLSGEIDGTIFVENDNGDRRSLANKVVQLLPLQKQDEKIIEAQAAFDGFYLFSKVPPGRYLMVPKPSLSNEKYGNGEPMVITIGYDGTVLYGQNIILKEGAGFVSYDVEYEDGVDFIKSPEVDYYLKVKKGGENKVSSIVSKLLFKKYAKNILNDLNFIEQKDNILIYKSVDRTKLHEACAALRLKKIECSINVIVFAGVQNI